MRLDGWWVVLVDVKNDSSVQTELSILGIVSQESQNDLQMLKSFQVVVGRQVENGFSVQTEQAMYDCIDAGTI